MSIIVFVISENMLVVYWYPCRLLSMWYQRTFRLYIVTHVVYCLCDIRDHTGCNRATHVDLLSLWYRRTYLVVYRYTCRLLFLRYQRTYWLYIDTRVGYCLCDIREHNWLYIATHVDYCLCDIREHSGCI